MNPLARLARKSDIDKAVALGIMTKCWQIPAGVVTMLLIAIFFTPETQGVYYTALGILGLQGLAEAGFQSVILHAASHEWSKLSLRTDGRLEGDSRALHRLASLARKGTIWFAVCGALFVVAATAWGVSLLVSRGPLHALPPLIISVFLSAMSLIAGGLIATLEGCNQVERVNWNRLLQAVTGSIVVWIAIFSGAELWAIPASFAAQLLWECYLVLGRYRPMMRQLLTTQSQDLDWRSEVWPLQWKISLQSIVRQFAFVPIIPVLYAWQGDIVAGQAGMTLSVINNLMSAASAWIRTRAPRLGELIAGREHVARDRLFVRTTVSSTLLLLVPLTGFCVVIFALNASGFGVAEKIAQRFLPFFATVWFALATIPQHLVQCFAMYIRAHKTDPLWRITIAANALLAVLVQVCGRWLGAYAIGLSMLFVFAAFTLPSVIWVWRQFREEQEQMPPNTR